MEENNNQFNGQPQNGYQGQPQNGYQGQPQNGYQGQPQNGYQGQPQNGYQGQPQNGSTGGGKGMCIASMILGIVSLVLFCIWWISIPCGILAIIFGVLGRKKPGKNMAIAGLVTGMIALALYIILVILTVAFGFSTSLVNLSM